MTRPVLPRRLYFDADSLPYLIDTGRLENPCREQLSRAVCCGLDEHVGDAPATSGAARAGVDRRCREAAVVTNALLDYHSQNRAGGGRRVVDDDERRSSTRG